MLIGDRLHKIEILALIIGFFGVYLMMINKLQINDQPTFVDPDMNSVERTTQTEYLKYIFMIGVGLAMLNAMSNGFI